MEGLPAPAVLACAVAIGLMTKGIGAARRRSSSLHAVGVEHERLGRRLAGPEGRLVSRRGWG